MKKIVVLTIVALVGLAFYNFSSPVLKKSEHLVVVDSIAMPDNVKAIVENSCYGCHNSESKSEKGKKKLQFDQLDKLSAFKAVGKLSDIQEVLQKGKMPPEKFLEKYPDHALKDDQKQTLMNWAKEESGKFTEK